MDIFEPLSEEEIRLLNGQLSDVHLEPNEIFYTAQDRTEKLFVLWKGRVRIYRTTDGGREVTLATVVAGTVFGEMALTAQQLQEAYAQANQSFAVLDEPDVLRPTRDLGGGGANLVENIRFESHGITSTRFSGMRPT